MDHFWRKPIRLNNHVFIGHTVGYYRPWGETVKFDSYLIDSYGRHWSKDMIVAERSISWKWN